MNKSFAVLALSLMLAACGDEGAQTTPAPAEGQAAAPAAAPAESAPPAAAAPTAEEAPAAAAEEELKYDPIDVSKLDNSWYRQFGGGK